MRMKLKDVKRLADEYTKWLSGEQQTLPAANDVYVEWIDERKVAYLAYQRHCMRHFDAAITLLRASKTAMGSDEATQVKFCRERNAFLDKILSVPT